MPDYRSVINTAKNGQLIRAEIREYVLSIGLYWGFKRPNDHARLHFPSDLHRQKQYTEVAINDITLTNENIADYNLKKLPKWLIYAITKYFKYENVGEHGYLIYDTKKFTHYRDRLNYGQHHLTRLNKSTMQYMWTPALLTVLYSYCYKDQQLDLSKCWFVTNAYDVSDNILAIFQYLKDICHITSQITINGTSIIFSDEADKEIAALCKNTALSIKQKLYNGRYVYFNKNEMADLTEDYKYGKKARKVIEAYDHDVSRQAKKNPPADR